MEEQLVALLAQTQSSETEPRAAAEQQLQQLYANEAFPLGLASIASHASVALQIRQAALLSLKNYVLAGWSPELEEYRGQTLLGEDTKAKLRQQLLELATSDAAERKVQSAASYVVSKIAVADFPDAWPGLLDALLRIIPEASDASVHGALKVLADLVDEGFEEQQLFGVAQQLVNVIYGVVVNQSRRPILRALAVSVFVPLLESLELLLQDHGTAVKAFAEQTMAGTLPVFLDIIKSPLPSPPSDDAGADDGSEHPYRGLVALKIQVARVLIKVRLLFPSLISSTSLDFFTAVWQELRAAEPVYQATYIAEDKEGRLEDSDGLPYTLDFLVVEDLDFLQSCLRAPPVRRELEKQLQEQGPNSWLIEILKLVVAYAQITEEEEGMWNIDVNVFLAEESGVTANYTARLACGDLVIKIGEWLQAPLVEAFTNYMRELFASDASWKYKEAALFTLNQVIVDWADMDNRLDSNITSTLLEFARVAQASGGSFLRARGYLASGTLLKVTHGAVQANVPEMIQVALTAINSDESEVVQVSCIRALQFYAGAMPKAQAQPLQSTIMHALETWMSSKDMHDLSESDDLLIALVETLRDIILLDIDVCINGNGLNLLFTVASGNASSFQMIELVTETFEAICREGQSRGPEMYNQLCQRVLPSLIGAFDVGDLTEENALMSLAAELLSTLAKYGPEPLPANFVSTVMPKLYRLLTASQEDDLLRACTMTVKHIIFHDPEQIFSWSDGAGKNGLEAVLIIIDRILGPSVDDAAAAEIGGLASAVVEKAGSERLGPYLMQLLQAVAQRVASAEQAHLVQSLISVYARLALTSPADVVEFLSQVHIGQQSGLQVVMAKWLDNAAFFTGYEDIRQNTIALAKLYGLHDPRLEQVVVKGDLIVKQSDRIMTRSKARQNPDQYTLIPVPLKIIKLLVDELAVGGAANQLEGAGAAGAIEAAGNGGGGSNGGDAVNDGGEDEDDDDDDGEWEDEPGAFDNFGGSGMSKSELLAFANESPLASRAVDDETQRFLGDFFRGVATEAGFAAVFGSLSEEEQGKLRTLN